MKNQKEIVEMVDLGNSKKGMLGKAALAVAGIAAGVGTAIFLKRRNASKPSNEVEKNSEDSQK